MTHWKLVRDEIPGIISDTGKEVHFRRIMDKEELERFYEMKLHEEYTEWRCADSKEEQLMEIADVLQVMCDMTGVELGDVMTAAFRKQKERGGFKKGYIVRFDR